MGVRPRLGQDHLERQAGGVGLLGVDRVVGREMRDRLRDAERIELALRQIGQRSGEGVNSHGRLL